MLNKRWATGLLIGLIICCATIIMPIEAYSDDNWTADKERVSSLPCDEKWNVIWSSIKKGNIDARAALLYQISFAGMLLPAEPGDVLYRFRVALILAVHSTGFKEDWYNQLTKALYGQFRFLEQGGYGSFFTCVEKQQSASCVNVAVEEKLVPEFAEFIQETELFLAQGKKAQCLEAESVKPNNSK